MKINLKIMLPALLLLAALAACEKSPVKRDYEPEVDAAPQGVVSYEAEVFYTKVRVQGKVANHEKLSDYGFLYCVDSLLNKADGNFETAVQKGYITENEIISLKKTVDSDDLSYVFFGKLQPNTEYTFATFAINSAAITFGTPESFKTGANYKSVYDLTQTSKQSEWESYVSVLALSTENVRPFEYVFDELTKMGSYISYAKAGPTKYTPDNWLIFSSEIGFDMTFEYLLSPLSDKVSGYYERYAVLISTDSITADNYQSADVLFEEYITPDSTVNEDGTVTLTIPTQAVRKLAIPAKYENQKAWIAVRHYKDYTQGLEVKAVKLW